MIIFESDCLIFGLVFLAVTLLLCGDMERNPGPKVRYPCSTCCLPVRRNQKALLCDLCELWCHCKCSSVDDETYWIYQCISSFMWNCPRCIAGCLPFHDCSFLTSEESMVTCFDDGNFSAVPSLVQANNGLRVAHLNCRSFLSHKDEIVQLICTLHLDVLTVSETWLDDTVPNGEILPVGFNYSLYHRDRNHHGGGVAILISNCIFFRPRLDLSSGQVESIWGNFTLAVNIHCCYVVLIAHLPRWTFLTILL